MRPYLVAALLSLLWAQTDITPRSPSRTDTTVQGSVNPSGPTYPGPISGPTPGALYLYTLRECLDSLYVHLCNVPSGSDMEDTYLQIINLTKSCTVRTGLGYCLPSSWPFPCPPFCPPPGFGGPQAGIKLYHDTAASGTNNLLFAQPAPMRLAQGDQLLIIVQPEFDPDPTDVLTFELQVNEYRYPNAGGNPAAGLPTPSIAPRQRRVCFNGLFARDTFSTGINNPDITHYWYINGNLVPGAHSSTFIATFTQPGPHTVIVELRWRSNSYCIPPNVPWPRDTAIIETDTIPDTYVYIDGSPYYHNTYASFTGSPPFCLTYEAQPNLSGPTYTWIINRSSYTGPGPHTECYTRNTLDTVVFTLQNGLCTRYDTIYVIVDVGTSIATGQILSDISYFPNPTREKLWLRSSFPGPWQISLWNAAGQKVFSFEAHLPTEIPLPTLPAGLYWIRLQSGDYLHSGPLRIE